LLRTKPEARSCRIPSGPKGNARIELARAAREDGYMKKLVFFCDSSIYIQTVDEEPVEKTEE
jgi:hypothetical protein